MKNRLKICSLALCAVMLYQICFPAAAYALTGGPSQPEVESFEPVGTSEMVDVFSGDFNYNIPLLDVDGYPVNIAYHSGITMDQEASWVGLGWNLNPGVMNRNMRGLPDDFKGDLVSKIQYIKPNRTMGLGIGYGIEIAGFQGTKGIEKFLKKFGAEGNLGLNLGVNYNNYTGLGIESSITPSITGAHLLKTGLLKNLGLNAQLRIASSSKDGLTIQPKIGMSSTLLKKGTAEDEKNFSLTNETSVSMTVNSRSGVKALSIKSSTKANASKTTAILDKAGRETDKKNTSGGGYAMQSGGTISFGTETYTPSISQEMNGVNFSFNTKLGLQLPFLNPNFSYSGYYAAQSVKDAGAVGSKAYGNIYSEYAGESSLRDFNREKDGSFSEKNPVLAIPVSTYDLYQASGQGIGGMFKPYRGDIPVVHDQAMENSTKGGSLGPEFAKGNLIKAGLNITFNYSNVSTGMWQDGNHLMNRFDHPATRVNNPYEPSYFKQVGEKSEVIYSNKVAYKAIENGALRPKLEQKGNAVVSGRESITSENKLVNGNNHEEDITSATALKTQRDKRNMFMSYRTGKEKAFCLSQTIKHLPATADPSSTVYNTTTRDGGDKDNHISEITVAKNDGARYVYGIPAYNKAQYDISFTNAQGSGSSGAPDKKCELGQVTYSGINNILSPVKSEITGRNHKGIDEAFQVTKTPAYAHSYLLTDVLSADYVDLSGDGPDFGDYGSYTHFTYYKTNENYKWRVPYLNHQANYNEGLKSDPTDDNANVIYGEKEVWHVARIEGKNHYALFHISERKDGYGVVDQHGGRSSSSPSYKLDKIELYAYVPGPGNQTLIKTVYFEYDYSLCPNVENNSAESLMVNGVNLNQNKGKLTLKKIWFEYASSTKGRFNAYTFNYSSTNPSYNLKGYDRWGNYKPNPLYTEVIPFNCSAASYTWPLSNGDFPYTDQDKFPAGNINEDKYKANVYASAWHLSQIVLPSGGVINVEYEADDYAYVQDKEATQMAKLIGFCDYVGTLATTSTPLSSITHSGAMYNQSDPEECMLFRLPKELSTETDLDALKQRLKNGLGQYLYYNFLVNLTDGNEDTKNFEYVRGYTEITDAGIINSGNGDLVGWVKVGLKAGDSQHPISRSAWQYARMYLPHLVYPGSNLRKKMDGEDVGMAFITGLVGFIPGLMEMVEGINNKLRRNNFGKDVLPDKSWIRIPTLTGRKFGGGSRVKKLWLNDKWNDHSTSGINMSYGQEYSYTMQTVIDGQTRVISSGVASYEPTIGNDENPWKQPVVYDKENIGVPDDEFYSEEPFGESYFPSPSVGYSRVEVKNLVPVDAAVNAHGTGKVVHQYYTAKDFPVITSKTGIDARSYETSALFSILGLKAEQDMTMSQGFQVELNDMHGKPKATLNYDQNNILSYSDADAFSGIKYNYEVQDPGAARKVLKNRFKVVDKSNSIRMATVGLESEMVMDSRMHQSKSISGGIQLNAEFYTIPPFPIASFFAWPDYSSEYSTFKSTVLVRVVNRFGLLSSTEAFEEGSSIKTENVLLDAETGETLLTKTYNEYKDPVFNLTMPAHWAYDGMGQAYKNTGLRVAIERATDYNEFRPKSGMHADYFADGDMIRIEETGAEKHYEGSRFYVRNYNNKWYLLDAEGENVVLRDDADLEAVIMRSGRKNMQALPVMQVSSLAEPVSGTNLSFTNKEVLNASAITYHNKWRVSSSESPINNLNVERIKELLAIANHLFLTEELTTANYKGKAESSTLYTVSGLPSSTNPPTILPLSQLYLNTTGNGTIYYKPLESFLNSGWVLNFRNANGTGIYNIIIEDYITKAILKLNDYKDGLPEDGTNNICPVKFEFRNMLAKDRASVMLHYKDAGGTTRLRAAKLIFEFSEFPDICDNPKGYATNPYTYGTEANWRKQKDWVFYGDRVSAANTNLRKDGTISNFASYWTPGSGKWNASESTGWTCTNEITRYSRNGEELENKDALGRYSSAIYGRYFLNKPLAVAGNAAYNQIGVETAEEPPFAVSCNEKALDFESFNRHVLDQAHTGKYSLKLSYTASALTASHTLKTDAAEPDRGEAGNLTVQNDYNGLFNPTPGKYVFGAWVKVDVENPESNLSAYNANKKKASYAGIPGAPYAEVLIHNGGAPVPVPMYPKGQIIEGWQRIEGEFTIGTCIKVEFKLHPDENNGMITYYDDMRVHPFDAKLKTYVYDKNTQLLSAELDENNYATFYEYNAEGKLVRVKKETEKGIVTLKEVRSNQHKPTPTP